MRLLLAALFAVAALTIAGCGGDDDASSDSTAAPEASATEGGSGDVLDDYESMDLPLELADGMRLGQTNAPVTLTLFEDFQCPYCLAFNLAYEDVIIEEYVRPGKVMLEFRNFPILGPESEQAALAGFCVAEQNVFWPFHNRLFLEQAQAGQLEDEQLNVGRFSDENLRQFAEEAGAEPAEFDTCMTGDAALAAVQKDVTDARALGVRGTPGVVVDGAATTIPSNVEELRALLDGALEE